MKLTLKGLVKEFISLRGKVAAVKGIDLEIRDKEFFVLLGPSGCGKSTVLNLIAGLEKPSRGEILFDDRLVASGERRVFLSPRERNVAMVFQTYALYPHLSIFENIAFPLKIAGKSGRTIDESVQRVAAMLGIEGLLSAKPAELSGGQRQRVAIARAIVRHPTVFLLDEPLSNLDAQLRASTRAELKNLQRQLGITTVYVTHDQVEAMSLGDRIALLKDGRTEQIGAAEELYERPANTFVARFIGSPPMNLVETALIEEDAALWILLGGRKLRVSESKASSLKEHRTQECILGLKPELIAIRSDGEPGQIQGSIRSVEPQGREILIHTSVAGSQLTVLTTDKRYAKAQTGEAIRIELDLEKALFFRVSGKQTLIA